MKDAAEMIEEVELGMSDDNHQTNINTTSDFASDRRDAVTKRRLLEQKLEARRLKEEFGDEENNWEAELA